jgi:uncharacterized protein
MTVHENQTGGNRNTKSGFLRRNAIQPEKRHFPVNGVLWLAACAVLLLLTGRETVSADSSYTNPETGYEAVIEDQADLLTEDEEEDLAELLCDVTDYCNAAFVTISSNPYYNTQRFAESYSNDAFPHSSAVVFVVDMDNRYLYMDSSGTAQNRITSAYADTITDNVYRYASDGDYYTCAYKAFSQVGTLMRGQRIAQPMKYISNALLAIVLAMLINFVIVKAKSQKHKATANELLSGIYSNFQIHDAKAVFTHQTKTYSPRSSDSGGGGGGSSGGGGGGGGHSGGGHSF